LTILHSLLSIYVIDWKTFVGLQIIGVQISSTRPHALLKPLKITPVSAF
jgi:hypothetical protein